MRSLSDLRGLGGHLRGQIGKRLFHLELSRSDRYGSGCSILSFCERPSRITFCGHHRKYVQAVRQREMYLGKPSEEAYRRDRSVLKT